MELICISDIHNKYKSLEMSTYSSEATLIVAGDLTSRGTIEEMMKALRWIDELQFKHKIIIVGNHDYYAEKYPKEFKTLLEKFPTITYLENSSTIIEGVRFWGTPDTPEFCNWAFNKSKEELASTWGNVPKDVDVLITHGPPYGILDKVNNSWSKDPNVGCKQQLEMILKNKIPVNIFGHIHENGCTIEQVEDTLFINASVLDERYNLVHKPVTIHYEGTK